MTDPSNGYDAIARAFTSRREQGKVGAGTVRAWAASVRPGGTVLDVGCGAGVPVSQALVDAGLKVHAFDASPALLAEYRARFPTANTQCAPVEESDFFRRTFDGIIAWGVMFLLTPEAQRKAIGRFADHLVPRGRLLFTAPEQVHEWADVMTGETSISLGAAEYSRLLAANGFALDTSQVDEGGNHYFLATKTG